MATTTHHKPLTPQQLMYLRATLDICFDIKLSKIEILAMQDELAYYVGELGIEVHALTRKQDLAPLAELL
jgi:hypothetical protein